MEQQEHKIEIKSDRHYPIVVEVNGTGFALGGFFVMMGLISIASSLLN